MADEKGAKKKGNGKGESECFVLAQFKDMESTLFKLERPNVSPWQLKILGDSLSAMADVEIRIWAAQQAKGKPGILVPR